MREFKTLTQLYIYVNATLIYTCISSMPFSDIFIFNATLWYLYLQCHSLISLSSMPLWYLQCHSDIYICIWYILNATCTLWCIYPQCHSVNTLSSMPLRCLYHDMNATFICLSSMLLSLTLFSMPLYEVFIINATLISTVCHSQKSLSWVPLWLLFPQCHYHIFILNATLWILYPQCHSEYFILNATLWSFYH